MMSTVSFKNMRILVIEPGDEARSQMKLFFEKRGAIVHSVGRLEKIKTVVEGAIQSNELFDLILIEVRLPDCWEFYPEWPDEAKPDAFLEWLIFQNRVVY